MVQALHAFRTRGTPTDTCLGNARLHQCGAEVVHVGVAAGPLRHECKQHVGATDVQVLRKKTRALCLWMPILGTQRRLADRHFKAMPRGAFMDQAWQAEVLVRRNETLLFCPVRSARTTAPAVGGWEGGMGGTQTNISRVTTGSPGKSNPPLEQA